MLTQHICHVPSSSSLPIQTFTRLAPHQPRFALVDHLITAISAILSSMSSRWTFLISRQTFLADSWPFPRGSASAGRLASPLSPHLPPVHHSPSRCRYKQRHSRARNGRKPTLGYFQKRLPSVLRYLRAGPCPFATAEERRPPPRWGLQDLWIK